MDAGSLKLIHRLISMGSSSLLQYVSEAAPWSADGSHAALDRVVTMAHTERDEVTRLVRLLQKKHLPLAVTGSYPSHFTTMNFVTLDYLLPKLISEHEKERAEFESQLHTLDDEEIRKLVQTHLDMKRGHLQTLKELAAPLAA
jgi:rubrerythrin